MAESSEQHTVDRAGWPAGPWDGEPDYLSWTDEASGIDCAIKRNSMGALCGYVAVPANHALHGVHYSASVPANLAAEVERVMQGAIGNRGMVSVFMAAIGDEQRVEILFDVHGSLTYSGDRFGDGRFWYGFDCGHAGDVCPSMVGRYGMVDAADEYRDLEYVKGQRASLARQLAAMQAIAA